jgi:beta-lactamase class A
MNNSEREFSLKNDLEYAVNTMKSDYGVDADIKVSVYDIRDKLSVNVRGDISGWAASTIKLPIMVGVLRDVESGRHNLLDKLVVDHRLVLEKYDYFSRVPDGSLATISSLLYEMIVNSDNTATNILLKDIGIEEVNNMMWDMGMKRSMIGHLLCPGVPRYISSFNPDGSNITCPNDMVEFMRNIYDPNITFLSPLVKGISDTILSATHPSFFSFGGFPSHKIKTKSGVIHDEKAGDDMHETGIIDDHLIVSIMLNKIGQNKTRAETLAGYFIPQRGEVISEVPDSLTPVHEVYSCLLEIINRNVKLGQSIRDPFTNNGKTIVASA